MEQNSPQSGGIRSKYPVKEGGVFGAAAFVAALVVTFLLTQIDSNLSDTFDRFTDTGVAEELGIGTLDLVTWAFFNAQFVDVELTRSFEGESGSETFSVLSGGEISEAGSSLPEPLYTAVPVLVLVGAGYLLVKRVGARDSADAAKFGAGVAVGYLPLVFLAVFLSRSSVSEEDFSTTYSVELLNALLLPGLLFPLALGAAGGYIAFSQLGPRPSLYSGPPPRQQQGRRQQ